MRSIQSVRLWLLAAGIACFGWVSAASAVPIYQSDFSDYEGDFAHQSSLVTVAQNAGDVELWGTGTFNAALSRDWIPVVDLPGPGAVVTLTVLGMEIPGAASLRIIYYDGSDLHMNGLDEIPLPSVVVGDNTAPFGAAPPLGAQNFRVQLRFDNGNLAILDHLKITAVPEPGTATLVALGLGLTALLRRRRGPHPRAR